MTPRDKSTCAAACLFAVALAATAAAQSADAAGEGAPDARALTVLEPRAVVARHEEGIRLKAPRGICYDAQAREVYVCDTGNSLVAVFDHEGRPTFAFGYGGEMVDPVGVAVDGQGRVYVIEGRPRTLTVFTHRGARLGRFPFGDLGGGPAPIPGAVAVDGEGRIFIGDNARCEVLVYDAAWKLVRRFGGPGTGPGQFRAIAAIAFADRRIVVLDATAIAVQTFDARGHYVFGFGEHLMGPENFSLPSGVAVDGDGRLFTTDMIRHDVKCLGIDGKVVAVLGGLGDEPGKCFQPSGVACDGKGRVYVIEQAGARLQALDRKTVAPKPRAAPEAVTLTARAPDERERARREALEAVRKMNSGDDERRRAP
jgi:DNA-binding beta-propeller fold protein YncE